MTKRDPERLLAAIRRAHEKHPELRVMQIIESACEPGLGLFYVENDHLAELIEAWTKEVERK